MPEQTSTTTPARTASIPSRSVALAARPAHEMLNGSEVFARSLIVEAMVVELMGEWYRNQSTDKRDDLLDELEAAARAEAVKMSHPGLTASLDKYADEFIAAVRATAEPVHTDETSDAPAPTAGPAT